MRNNLYYRNRRPSGEVSFNVTPLIDCTFLMILFVILGSQMAATVALPKVELPRPYASQAVQDNVAKVDKIVVNVVSAEGKRAADGKDELLAGQAVGYMIDGKTIELGDNESLVKLFAARKAVAGGGAEFQIEIRADRRVRFVQVQPVLSCAAEAGIAKANITTLLEGGK